jgi:PAS domain S-box-containing protein
MVEIPAPEQAVVQRVDLASVLESGDAIVGETPAGVINVCNRAAALLYGFTDQELVGRRAETLIAPRHRVEEAAIRARIAGGEDVREYLAQRLRSDGTVVPVSLIRSPIVDSAGVVTGIVTIAHPVSGLPATGERGAQIAEAEEVRDDQDRRFQAHIDAEFAKERVQINKAQEQFQLRMSEERARERILVAEAQDRFQVVMAAERAKERVEVNNAQDRFQLRMGEERAQEQGMVNDAQDRFQLRMGEERAQEQVEVHAAQDRFKFVTDAGQAKARIARERLEAQLNQSQRLEVLGQLAGGVAHDFNNLLAVILNYATFVVDDLAERGPELAETNRDVAQIQRAAERAAGLTQQLLAFARQEVVQFQVLDLNDVITEVEELLRRTLGEDVVLRTDLAPDLWPVLADAGQFEQILVNLAVNARHAMSRGGTLNIDSANVLVDADTEALLRAGRHVRLRISDTGSGMPAEIIEHVFEPFFTTKPEGAGTGLGLSTVYGIVTQAAGSITIHSSPGTGTTFTILVPVTDEVRSVAEQAQPYERIPHGETVLIVEDQVALREVTERIFARGGYQVLSAANGADAVALAAGHEGDIHLLITDVVMPNMLGGEVAERVGRLKPGVEVLYMSGYARPVLTAQGRLDGGAHLIEKPFTAASIIEKAGRILNGHAEGSHTPSGA